MVEEPRFHAADRASLRAWLVENAARSAGVWLVYDEGSKRSLPYDAIVEEALSFGWVDSRPRRLSDDQAMLYLAPRRPTSNWSRINKERVLSLRTQGLLTPAGEAAVETAVRNGHWEALAEVEELLEPDDLRQRLDTDAAARGYWDSFPPSTRRAILEWLLSAKTPATREKRVVTIVEQAHLNRRANHGDNPRNPGH